MRRGWLCFIAWIKKHVRTAQDASRRFKEQAIYPVEHAARSGSVRSLSYLLSFGVALQSALEYATHYAESSCIRVLLDAGAKPRRMHLTSLNQLDKNAHHAVWLLIQCGANPSVSLPHWMHLMHAHREAIRARALHTIAASMRAGLGRDMARWLGRHVWALRCVMPPMIRMMLQDVAVANSVLGRTTDIAVPADRK